MFNYSRFYSNQLIPAFRHLLLLFLLLWTWTEVRTLYVISWTQIFSNLFLGRHYFSSYHYWSLRYMFKILCPEIYRTTSASCLPSCSFILFAELKSVKCQILGSSPICTLSDIYMQMLRASTIVPSSPDPTLNQSTLLVDSPSRKSWGGHEGWQQSRGGCPGGQDRPSVLPVVNLGMSQKLATLVSSGSSIPYSSCCSIWHNLSQLSQVPLLPNRVLSVPQISSYF